MKNILFGIVVLSSLLTNAQHDNVWYFGRWAGLDFSSGTPIALTDSQMWAVEGCAVMSDLNGNLLFYTNGLTVWNRNHQVMENGTGLFGDGSTTMAAMIIPKPGNPARYYIFTPDNAGEPNGLHYSEVDMDTAGGLGAVINKNIALVAPVCEKAAATFHANGTDIWVTTHHWGSNAYYSYLVTEAGVNSTPVVSNAGVEVGGANNSGRYAGHMAFSPDGSHIAALHNNIALELLDFNNETGMVSNPKAVKEGIVQGYGAEFSPSGNLLYVTSGYQVLQYQTDSADIPATEVVLATTENIHGTIKIGPDSKLYVVTRALHPSVSVINDPDIQGVGCNFIHDQVNLGGRQTFTGLPSFLTSPFYLQDIIAAVDCTGSQFSFSVEATQSPQIITWDFGDGTTGEGTNVNHTYTTSGTYVVRATATRGIFRRYFTKSFTVTIVPPPAANQPQDMVLCDEGNDNSEIFLLSSQNMHIIGTQVPEDYTITYHADAEDAEAGINALPEDYQNISIPQTIYARVTDTATGCYATTSFAILIKPVPVIEMQDQYYICENNLIVLTAPAGFAAYLWSTGETTRTIFAAEGIYELTVTLQYEDLICEATKAIHVLKSGAPQIKDIIISDWTDTTNSITVVAEGVGNYEYSLDGVNYQPEPVFHKLLPGLYTVYVRDLNGCGIDEDDAVVLMYPRFFTPNSDGYNDFWRIKYANLEPEMLVYIYDRYGKLIYSFSGGSAGWDGTYNGSRLPSTDYWFFVKRKDGREHKGHFSMLR